MWAKAVDPAVRRATETTGATEVDGPDALFGEARATTRYTAARRRPAVRGVGNDWLFGGPGDDDLQGGAGFDILDGGIGNDILTWQLQRRYLRLRRRACDDVITDFEATNPFEKNRPLGGDRDCGFPTNLLSNHIARSGPTW